MIIFSNNYFIKSKGINSMVKLSVINTNTKVRILTTLNVFFFYIYIMYLLIKKIFLIYCCDTNSICTILDYSIGKSGAYKILTFK